MPAIVSTVSSRRSRRRIAWFPVSATRSVSPSRNSIPCGSANFASAKPPSARPRAPVPATARVSAPSPAASVRETTIRLWPESATATRPLGPEATLPGKRRAPPPTSGGSTETGVSSRVPASRCSSIMRAISRSRARAFPSPETAAVAYPAGSTSTRVGQARIPYWSQVARSGSSRTGWRTP
nr:hypothetical protein [Rubrobacter marinus]